MKTNIYFLSYLTQVFSEWEMFEIKFVVKIKTHILCSVIVFRKSWSFWDNVEKYRIASRPEMTIRRMRIACWIPKATDTHSEYVTSLLFHRKDGGTSAPQCYVIRTLPPPFNHFFVATTGLLIIQSSLCLCHEPVRYSYICSRADLK